MRFKLIAVLSIVAMMLLAACGGGGEEAPSSEGAASEPVAVDVVMHDIYFGDSNDNATNPPVWEVPANTEFTVNMENVGALEHNWAVVEQGATVPEPFIEADNSDILLADSGLVAGGESGTSTIPALLPGEYQVICTVAGHYPLMQGRLVVSE